MDQTERRARIAEEAAEWWVRLRADDLPREERGQFVDWLRESPANVAEMLRIAQVHGALENFAGWARIATEGGSDANVVPLGRRVERESAVQPRSRGMRRVGALAAGFAILAIAAGWGLFALGGQSIETERGERREVALADGSVLVVSPESKLSVRFDEGARRVALIAGSALFRVAKDASRPFMVEADHTVVRAVGTAFGVEHRRAGIVVTVSEGKVQVERQGAPLGLSSSDDPPVGRLTLNAGEQVAIPAVRRGQERESARADQGEVRKVDTTRALAWAEGRLVFESQSLDEVIAEFNRYNRVQLHVTDEALARRPVSGVFDASDPESFVAFVASVTPVRVERDENRNITLAAP